VIIIYRDNSREGMAEYILNIKRDVGEFKCITDIMVITKHRLQILPYLFQVKTFYTTIRDRLNRQ